MFIGSSIADTQHIFLLCCSLIVTNILVLKLNKKLRNQAFNHLSDVDFQEELKDLLAEKYSFASFQRYQKLRSQYQSLENKIKAISEMCFT
jgi:hypothetical protein